MKPSPDHSPALCPSTDGVGFGLLSDSLPSATAASNHSRQPQGLYPVSGAGTQHVALAAALQGFAEVRRPDVCRGVIVYLQPSDWQVKHHWHLWQDATATGQFPQCTSDLTEDTNDLFWMALQQLLRSPQLKVMSHLTLLCDWSRKVACVCVCVRVFLRLHVSLSDWLLSGDTALSVGLFIFATFYTCLYVWNKKKKNRVKSIMSLAEVCTTRTQRLLRVRGDANGGENK